MRSLLVLLGLLVLVFLRVQARVDSRYRTQFCLTAKVEGVAGYSRETIMDCIARFGLLLSSDELEALHYSYERLDEAARWVTVNHTHFYFTTEELVRQNNQCAETIMQLSFSLGSLSDFAYREGTRDMIRSMTRPSQLHALASMIYMKNHIDDVALQVNFALNDCNASYEEHLLVLENETVALDAATGLRNTYLGYVQANMTRLIDLEYARKHAFELHNDQADVWCAKGRYCPLGETITLQGYTNQTLYTGSVVVGPLAIFYDDSSCVDYAENAFVSEHVIGIASQCLDDPNNVTVIANYSVCPAGTYNNRTLQTVEEACILCAPGYYAPSAESSECIECVNGTEFGLIQCNF